MQHSPSGGELIWFWISMGETNVYTHVDKIINLSLRRMRTYSCYYHFVHEVHVCPRRWKGLSSFPWIINFINSRLLREEKTFEFEKTGGSIQIDKCVLWLWFCWRFSYQFNLWRDLCLDKCDIYIYSRKVLLFLVRRREWYLMCQQTPHKHTRTNWMNNVLKWTVGSVFSKSHGSFISFLF